MAANGRGNMRPAGRSPPFLAIGLFVALVILGFNYWSLSARNGEQANEISLMESELRLVNAKKTSAEKRGEAISDKITELEKQLNEQKEVIARNQAELVNVEKEKQTFIERTNQLEDEIKDIRDQQLPSCETEKKNLQQELEQLRADLEAFKNRQCDRSECETFVLKERDAAIEDMYKVVGALPLISMYRSSVNLGSYKNQIATLAANMDKKALEKQENALHPADTLQQQQPADSLQQQQQPADALQQQQQQQPADALQQQQQPADALQQQQQPADTLQQQQQPADALQQQQQPADALQQQDTLQQQQGESVHQQQQGIESQQKPEDQQQSEQKMEPGQGVVVPPGGQESNPITREGMPDSHTLNAENRDILEEDKYLRAQDRLENTEIQDERGDFGADNDNYDDDDDAGLNDETLRLRDNEQDDDDYNYDEKNEDDGDYNEKSDKELKKDDNTIEEMYQKDKEGQNVPMQ